MSDKTESTEKDSGYVVTAPYITVRVKDSVGSDVIQGFYAGARLPVDVNEDDLDKQVRKGMVAAKGTEEADAASPFGTRVTFDDNGNPLTPQQAADAEKAREARRNERQSARSADTSTVKAPAGRPAAKPAS
jgi:hypothetical protein